MSAWNHSLCYQCYRDEEPGREPHRVLGSEVRSCCRCGAETTSGIFYRKDPSTYRCKEQHEEES